MIITTCSGCHGSCNFELGKYLQSVAHVQITLQQALWENDELAIPNQ
jgi:hypothetical protein